jgi:hypothetical protein
MQQLQHHNDISDNMLQSCAERNTNQKVPGG